MLIGCGLSAPPAQAGYVVTLTQVGPDVVATGSGTIDLTGLSIVREGVIAFAAVAPIGGLIITGPTSATAVDDYTGFTGPANFGSGGLTGASTGSGGSVVMDGFDNLLAVPSGYMSGGSLSDSATYGNQTFATLGATPGVYTWTWGSAATDDSFTLDIPAAAVPEPSSLLLLALPLGLVMLLAARPRRAARIA
ncbi:MAG: hypothetical protein ACREE9_02960 [Stellaceae bacterium]